MTGWVKVDFYGVSLGCRGRSRSRAQAGEDRRHDLSISFSDAVFGCSVDIEVDRMTECGTCTGSGSKAGTSPTTCSACGGSGQVVSAVRTPLGMFQQVGFAHFLPLSLSLLPSHNCCVWQVVSAEHTPLGMFQQVPLARFLRSTPRHASLLWRRDDCIASPYFYLMHLACFLSAVLPFYFATLIIHTVPNIVPHYICLPIL